MVSSSSKMFVVQQYLKFLLKNVPFAVADPDHMIAPGVGIFAGIKERKEDIQDLILTDICPFSLGTGIINRDDPAKGNYMHTPIPCNSSLPASHSGCFSAVSDNQKMLPLHHPEEDPNGFMLLHEAYKTALDYAQENDGPANTSTRSFSWSFEVPIARQEDEEYGRLKSRYPQGYLLFSERGSVVL